MGLFDSAESQPVLRIRENMDVSIGSLKVKARYLVANKRLSAWHRIREFQQPLTVFGKPPSRVFAKGPHYHLVIDDRSSVPITPYQCIGSTSNEYTCVPNETLEKITDPDTVAMSSHDYAQTESEAELRRSHYYSFLGLAIMGLVIVVALLVILKVTGKI